MKTLRELFEIGTSVPKSEHLRWRDAGKRWHALSTADVRAQVAGLARALRARGLQAGDRVALLSRNSPRWALTDYALVTSGFVTVPLYPTLAPDQARFILDDSGARMLFVEDRAHLDPLASALHGAALEAVVLMDDGHPPDASVLRWSALAAEGGTDPDLPPASIDPADLATFVYTSGTTGRPKGVMLSHWNLASNVIACDEAVDLARIEHVNLSLLPLSHIFQRLVDYFLFRRQAVMVYCPNPLEAMDYFPAVRPTFFAAVPRLYEKIHAGFQSKLAQAPAPKRALARWALGVGRRRFEAWCDGGSCAGRVPPVLALQHRIADALVLRKVRGIFGGNVDVCFSGGAPIATETAEFLRAIGLDLLPGYGLTESSPVLCTNTKSRIRLGTVGPALPGVELRTAEDGELIARGPNIMQGYWKRPEDTAAALQDGWLHTGDLARIDERGYVSITGRKKELIVLSTGKKVQPALVEDCLARSPFVAQSVVVGEGRKFVTALVHPHLDALAAEAKARGIAFSSPEELLARRETRALVQESLERCCRELSDFERPKSLAFLPRELTLAAGELTPTLKLKRNEISANWASLIAGLYAGGKERE